MGNVFKFLDWLMESIAVLAFASATVVLFIQVILRFVFNSPMMWPEEFARIMFVWIVYIGAPVVIKNHANIEVDYFVQYLSVKVRRYLKVTLFIIVSVFLLFVAYQGAIMVHDHFKMKAYTMPISQAIWYIPIVLGFIMMAINTIRVIPDILSGKDLEESGNAGGDSI